MSDDEWRLGTRIRGWGPMSYGNYVALVHAHRALTDGWIFAIESYEIAVERGIVFG